MGRHNGPVTNKTKPRARNGNATRGQAIPIADASGERRIHLAIQMAVTSTVVLLPGGFDRWVLPKVLVLLAAAGVGAFAPARGRLPPWVALGLAGCAAALVGTAILGDAPLSQLVGRWPRYEGLMVLPAYGIAVWLGARVLGPGHRAGGTRVLFRATAWASIALTSIAALEAAGLQPIPSDATRPGSLTGSGTDQGILAAIFMVVLAVPSLRLFRGRTRVSRALLIYAGCGAGALGVALSASRIALVAVLAGIVLVTLLESTRAARSTGSRSATAGAVAFAAFAWGGIMLAGLAIPLTRARIVSLFDSASTWSDRPLIWTETMRLVAQRPWWGWGPSGFVDAIPAQHDADWYAHVNAQVTLDSPHSGYLQVLVAGGYPLLAGVVALCAVATVALRRRLRAANEQGGAVGAADSELIIAAVGAIAVLAVGLVTSFTTPSIVLLPALLAGASLARPSVAQATLPHGRTLRSLGIAAVAGFLVFTVTSTIAEFPLKDAIDAASRGDVAGAQSDFESAQRLRPWDSDIAQLAAQSMAQAADAGSPNAAVLAIAWASDSLARAPDSVLTRKALAVALSSQGNLDASLSAWKALKELAPFDPQVAHRLGGVLAMKGDLSAARDELERAATLSPTDKDILATLAYVYTQLGDDDAARKVQDRIDAPDTS